MDSISLCGKWYFVRLLLSVIRRKKGFLEVGGVWWSFLVHGGGSKKIHM